MTRIKIVDSFHDLVTTPLEGDLNALCWQRTLSGNFGEVVERLGVGEGITPLDDAQLQSLELSAPGRVAVEILLEDLRRLRDHDPVLECVLSYPRDEGVVPTDVYSFHVDRATGPTDTYLCTYHGLPSEGLRNDEAVQRVTVPETRAELLKIYGGKDDDDFLKYLSESCFDLHYVPVGNARPISFGVGNLWRVAVDYPGSPVLPFIHRAPATRSPRLILIS